MCLCNHWRCHLYCVGHVTRSLGKLRFVKNTKKYVKTRFWAKTVNILYTIHIFLGDILIALNTHVKKILNHSQSFVGEGVGDILGTVYWNKAVIEDLEPTIMHPSAFTTMN